jgi:hypothetical protein
MLYRKIIDDNIYKQWELGQVIVIRLVIDFRELVMVKLKWGTGKWVVMWGKRFADCWVLWTLCVLVYFCCCSEGACVSNCKRLGLVSWWFVWGGCGNVVTHWWRRGEEGEDGVRVNGMGQKEYLGRRKIDCSTGEWGRVKRMRITIRE